MYLRQAKSFVYLQANTRLGAVVSLLHVFVCFVAFCWCMDESPHLIGACEAVSYAVAMSFLFFFHKTIPNTSAVSAAGWLDGRHSTLQAQLTKVISPRSRQLLRRKQSTSAFFLPRNVALTFPQWILAFPRRLRT